MGFEIWKPEKLVIKFVWPYGILFEHMAKSIKQLNVTIISLLVAPLARLESQSQNLLRIISSHDFQMISFFTLMTFWTVVWNWFSHVLKQDAINAHAQ